MNPGVSMNWGVRIPLRDGVHLNATVYLPKDQRAPLAAIFTLMPYTTQWFHDRGLFFAAHGYPFLAVDTRGRGNSEGNFWPNINEARDGYDVVEWLANEPYCNGQVAMWGGSYGGYAQWATAKEFPPHLVTIVPVASPCMGVDVPIRSNIGSPYWMQWLTLVWGRTLQDKLVWGNPQFWGGQFRRWFESGMPFSTLDAQLGIRSEIFQEWLAHPTQDAYWDSHNPTEEQYGKISLPILSVTGIYDADQPGALAHYREHTRHATPEGRARHYLIIGPWDHSGTRTPQLEFGGLTVGPASLLDLPKLHLDWYAWTMRAGPKPEFLQQNVAYYVMGAEKWRYAQSLNAITDHWKPLYLHATHNPTDVFGSGSLMPEPQAEARPDHYVYDPRDRSLAGLECCIDPYSLTDQRMIHASAGKILVYHSGPFASRVEISGFFKLSAWLSIDQPDTDFRAAVYCIDSSGRSVLLSMDMMRARHRESLRGERLVHTAAPLRYDFRGFTFVSRLLEAGQRLRLVIGPINSIYHEKNYNSGGVVAHESLEDARAVTVKLFHDAQFQSVLYVPIGKEDED